MVIATLYSRIGIRFAVRIFHAVSPKIRFRFIWMLYYLRGSRPNFARQMCI